MPPSATSVSPDVPVSLTPCAEASTSSNTSAKKKLSWKKPKNMPKRPLSAYNLFFQAERRQLMIEVKADQASYELKKRQHKRTSGVGFAGLARKIAQKWKTLGEKEREPFEKVAREDRRRYHEEIKIWKLQNGDTKGKKSRSKSLPVEEVFSTPAATAQMHGMQPRRASCDPTHQDMVSNQRLSFLNSSTRQTRLLLQQMAMQLEALKAMAASQTPQMASPKPPMPVMSHDGNFSNPMQEVHPVTPELPRARPYTTTANSNELPYLQPFDSVDQLEVSTQAADWDELVEHISEDMDERIAAEDDNTTLESLWGDVCNL
eukprot:CAMPEP_0194047798 /NCGR_PEP_ID=MMETSP0009_2-20130614/25567_1 /TAXON_ID=210454 /ORGANISM="Grammatophora oceanica, Strain CCMP 410" /LENGTH=317 /DNA_ID=CAMNT_0038693513 /DNA_START=87 /DNA_END=1040 /DNA_ORIENTATION=+